MSRCLACNQPTDQLISVIRGNRIVEGCAYCLGSDTLAPTDMAAKSRRQNDLRRAGGDVIQPTDLKAYRQQYGLDALRQHYDEETIRRYS